MHASRPFLHLQKVIEYTFRQPEWLVLAMTHRSHSAANNERLEFVGDGILNYTVARMLYDAFPKLSEGKLSRLRANLVNQEVLAEIAQELALGDVLLLGAGEMKSGGFNRPSILADAMEALFAAVSFDADFQAAEALVRRLYHQRVADSDLSPQAKDAKSRLQEALQAAHQPLPKYRIVRQSGEAHEQEFEVSCDLGETGIITTATALSRRAAEQNAAELALSEWEKYRQKWVKK